MMWRKPDRLALCFVLSICFAHASVAAQSDTTSYMLPWLQVSPTSATLTFRHEASWTPERGVQWRALDWDAAGWRFAAWGGELTLTITGEGNAPALASLDQRATLTLQHVDLSSMMKQFEVPRARELEGRVSGTLAFELDGKKWREVLVDLQTEPGSTFIDRGLLGDMLGKYLYGALDPKTLDDTLNHYYGAQTRRIPLESVAIRGQLNQGALRLDVPLVNEALSIRLEPRVEEHLLWELWALVSDKSFNAMNDLKVDRQR